jgi:formylglycine-generating enzyme required for sulfatase activity
MAYKATFQFPLRPEQYAASPIPTFAEWQALWAVWDAVTQQMIPKEQLLTKPIKLRNACIFYIGHIPTFLAIHLHRATGKSTEGLKEYQQIFERGIDPDVDNPELCHSHSEIPDEWPPEEAILAFQSRVRAQVRGLYDDKAFESNHAVQKALWIGFEHEVMHIETLLYMLIQTEKTLSPPDSVRPDFEAIWREARAKYVPNKWINVPARTVTLGLCDADEDTTTERHFGWDNEKPQRRVDVLAFTVQSRPITNGEYAKYLEATESKRFPASWSTSHIPTNEINGYVNGQTNDYTNGYTNGHTAVATAGHENRNTFIEGKFVRTVYGPVPLNIALDWPVMSSYDELAGFARWSNGRIPTMEEVKSIYEYANELRGKQFENALGKMIPAVNR